MVGEPESVASSFKILNETSLSRKRHMVRFCGQDA